MDEILALGARWPGGVYVLAVIGLVLSERAWVRVLCAVVLALGIIWMVYQVMTEEWNPIFLITPLVLLGVGLCAHGIQHMFDPVRRERTCDDSEREDSDDPQ
ncbi:MAG: hypothetical protein QGG42_08235 [Phycisphaerae bacterium]|jgi:fatty acid desaturase|nr:hypothetical protein [Phycisphaerae bacterium]